jgi:hypothetical protein
VAPIHLTIVELAPLEASQEGGKAFVSDYSKEPLPLVSLTTITTTLLNQREHYKVKKGNSQINQ